VQTSRLDVATAIVEWALVGQGPAGCALLVWDGAVELAMAAEAAGLRPEGRDAWSGLFLDAPRAAADPRRTVAGYRLRSMDEATEIALPERVAVHRAAWRPASLPYADGRVVDEAAESSFSADVYATIRSTWLYDESLDLVAVARDGELAASCIAWYDPSTGVAEIEPLGVSPDHRRRGLAVALCLEVAHRVVARGGSIVYINGTPDPAYPAPSAAYLKAGFRLLPRATTYRPSMRTT
jgi:predicted N-acetyltransferase YhbS